MVDYQGLSAGSRTETGPERFVSHGQERTNDPAALPSETRARALFSAACLLAAAGILSCKPRPAPVPPAAAQMAACRAMCAPLVVDGWFEHRFAGGRDLGAACVCAEPPAGRRL